MIRTPTLLGPLEEAKQWLRLGLSNGANRVGASSFYPRTEIDPVSETLFLLEYQTMDKVQKPNFSSKLFRLSSHMNVVTEVCSWCASSTDHCRITSLQYSCSSHKQSCAAVHEICITSEMRTRRSVPTTT
jgi:hypothetical protein